VSYANRTVRIGDVMRFVPHRILRARYQRMAGQPEPAARHRHHRGGGV